MASPYPYTARASLPHILERDRSGSWEATPRGGARESAVFYDFGSVMQKDSIFYDFGSLMQKDAVFYDFTSIMQKDERRRARVL